MCYGARIEHDPTRLAARFGAEQIRTGWDLYQALQQNPSGRPIPPLGSLIYPGSFAPVLAKKDGKLVLHLMKYSVEPPSFVSEPIRYTTYNARRDNLASAFWSESYRHHHGFIVIKGFFEWVNVQDLVTAGKVSLDSIKAAFVSQQGRRRAQLAALGKPFRPTKAELADPLFRRVVIEFSAPDEQPLLAPVIYSCRHAQDGSGLTQMGFAIVTDTPPQEVVRAGHDRCPIFLTLEAATAWLEGEGHMPATGLDHILDRRPHLTLTHRLAAPP